MMDQENYPNRNENGEDGAEMPKGDGESTPLKKKRPPIVLKFKKRFYDGEQEVELIKRLERRYQEMQFDENATQKTGVAASSTTTGVRPSLRVVNPKDHQEISPTAAPAEAVETVAETNAASKKQQILQALFLGPLEISVAILGVITAGFAMITFACFKNQELNQHSQVVLVECRKAFIRGIKNTISGPGKALQHLKKTV